MKANLAYYNAIYQRFTNGSKSWHYFANKRRSLGRHSSLADQSHGVEFTNGTEETHEEVRLAGGPRGRQSKLGRP
jgi:predicted membrane chloride channel (bestrophin family)